VITFNQVNKSYARQPLALNHIQFALNAGEMLFIQGHSGAGKSTLLKLIAALEPIDSGELWVQGENLATLRSRHLPYHRRQLGIILQHPQLLHNYSVFDNVAMPLMIQGYDKLTLQHRVRAALTQVGLLHKAQTKPQWLATGEQQRVGIARAIVHRPNLLLADEPTGNLDPILAQDIMQLFKRFNQVGMTIVIATHDSNLLNTLPYRKITLQRGEIIADRPANAAQEPI
jgi:cell division transport system ATP-binding protein